MSVLRMVLYIAAQCVGAIAGAFYARSLSPFLFESVEGGRNDLSDRVKVDWGGNVWSTIGAEICGTALLVFTVSAAADAGREQAFKCVPGRATHLRRALLLHTHTQKHTHTHTHTHARISHPTSFATPLQVRGRAYPLDDRLRRSCRARGIDPHRRVLH
jgi:glycerol uptake facilitator-like aquaporin